MVARLGAIALILLAANAQPLRVQLAGRGVVRVETEEYVAWVLAGEAGGMNAPAALEAQAIVARTYARANRGRHSAEGFDFCETTHCQDARPAAVTATVRAAAVATEGVILWFEGRPAQVFYTRHCGGRTAAAGEIWPDEARPYLKSIEDTYCLAGGRGEWSARIAWRDLEKALGLDGLREMEVAGRTASGRVAALQTNAGRISAERLDLQVGRALGWELLRSRVYNMRGGATHAFFEGTGAGHGVGLCQAGAVERAKVRHSAEQILAAYFPGTRAGVAAKNIGWHIMQGERVEVWSAGAAGDERIAALADQAFAEAERRSSLRIPGRPQVRVYPSLDIYRDATGEPGTHVAVTRGKVIHLQPATRLRSPESTLLHEMLHVVLGMNATSPLPLWFEEGLADYLGGGESHPVERARVERMIRARGLAAVMAMLRGGVSE